MSEEFVAEFFAEDDGAASFWSHPVHLAMADDETTSAYRESVVHCLELIQRESPRQQFLNFGDNHAENAAIRLAAYWRDRFELFGPTSAFESVSEMLTEEDKIHLLRAV